MAHGRDTRYLKLDSGIRLFEAGLITGVWVQHITSLSTWDDWVLCKLMLGVLIFQLYFIVI